MKSLIESLLDDEEDMVNDQSSIEHYIEDWIYTNMPVVGKMLISKSNNKFIVDMIGDVWTVKPGIKKIPADMFTIGKITGDFDIRNSNIETLKGCPTQIGGNLYLGWCVDLKNLDYAPKEVNKISLIDCVGIKSLKGLQSVKHCTDINCSGTSITNLDYLPKDIKNLNVSNCKKLKDFSKLPRELTVLKISGKQFKFEDFSNVHHIEQFVYYTAVEASMSGAEWDEFTIQMKNAGICKDFKLMRI